MKSGIIVNLLQIAFSYHTVKTGREQKPAEFLNSCLTLFGVATTLLIGYGHYWINRLDVEHIEIGQRKRRASIMLGQAGYDNQALNISEADLQRLQLLGTMSETIDE